MPGIRRLTRRLLDVVAQRVGKDDLFEQPGERAPTAPLPRATTAPATSPVPPTRPRVAPTAPPAAARPKVGCVPVDATGLRAALVPSGRPLVVNHWATWCDPCVEEMPRLVRAAAGAGELAEFVGVSWELFDHPGEVPKVAARVARFADSMGIGYPSVLYTGTPESLFAACGLESHLIPQTFVYAPDGRLAWHHAGILTDNDVFPLIQAVKDASRS